MIAIDTLQGNRKEKYAQEGNKKEKNAEGITKAYIQAS